MAYFSCLKLEVLQDHASRWANTFSKVNRISLHQYIGHQEPPATFRFAIIFELDLETEVQEKQEDGSLKVSSEAFDIIAYDYFDGDRFKMVYNYENIDPHYKNEWFFFPKYSTEKWPDFAPEEPCWQLFPIESIADIEEFDKKQNIAPQTVESQIDPAQERGTSEQKKAVNFFTRENDYWHIGFEGQETRIKNLTGLLYIDYLLKKPGTPHSCINLFHAANPSENPTMANDQAAQEGLNISTKSRIVHKKEGKRADNAIRDKWYELKRDLESAESELERKEIQEEMNMLLESLKSENKLPNPENANAQINIKKRLEKAYKTIGKVGMKKLEKHLRDHIKPDGAYGLSYSGSITWDISP